jgi:hypothetical protein
MTFEPERYRGLIESGLTNQDQTRFWLSIPKCASNTISSYLLRMGWKDAAVNDKKYQEIQVFLRDPISRWKSATLELCHHHLQHNQDDDKQAQFKEWFLNRKFQDFDHNVDLHHVRQTDFLYCCDIDACNFTLIDKDIDNKIKNIFSIKQEIISKNTTKGNENKEIALPYVEEIMNDQNLIDKIKDFYRSDFELIEKVIK